MARSNIRAATSFVLIPVLVLQTACYSARGPAEPVRPEDNEQMATLRDADHVAVVLVDGREDRLRYIALRDHRLHGFSDESQQVTSFPLDSIQSVQAYVDRTHQAIIAVGLLVTVVGFLVLLNNTDACDFTFCGFDEPLFARQRP